MATIAVVKECLLALSDRTGSSLPAINKWIESEKKVSVSKVLTEFYSVLPDDAIFELLGARFTHGFKTTMVERTRLSFQILGSVIS